MSPQQAGDDPCATLKGFEEPVTLSEVRRFLGEGGEMRGAQSLQL